jgi:hypothetical protein
METIRFNADYFGNDADRYLEGNQAEASPEKWKPVFGFSDATTRHKGASI